MKNKHLFLAITLLLISSIGLAQKIPARPVPPSLVNDFANILTDKQERVLEHKLVSYNDTTSTQICIVTIDDLDGTTANDFAYQIGEKWGVGHKGNNGAVILVKPKRGNAKGEVAIQVGYGLEPYVTDAAAKRIIVNEMLPSFREGDYYDGIQRAVDIIIGLASGAFTAEEYNENNLVRIIVTILSLLVFVVFILIFISLFKGGGGNKRNFWRTMFFLNLLLDICDSINSNHGRNSRDNGGLGNSGGFGGGRFGGGGASGSW